MCSLNPLKEGTCNQCQCQYTAPLCSFEPLPVDGLSLLAWVACALRSTQEASSSTTPVMRRRNLHKHAHDAEAGDVTRHVSSHDKVLGFNRRRQAQRR